MFQNIQKNIQYQTSEEQTIEQENNIDKENNFYKDTIEQENNIKQEKPVKEILKNLFSIKTISFLIVSFAVSMVGFQSQNIILSISPFAISFLAAMLSNYKTIGVTYILTLIGTFISFGANSLLIYFLTTLVFFVFVLLKRPKEVEGVNEQRRLGVHLFLAVLIVQVVPMFFRSFYVYDLLTSLMLAISAYVFYKIFANSIFMLQEFGTKKAFSIEEVMGTSLLLAIAICALGNFTIFGFSVRNILSILLVLILGWKNGMLVGATGGITIGVVLGIIQSSNPIMVASYAISGMLAGLFYRLGKIGVVVGFILGNILLAYVSNGNTVPIILFQEILIAFLGLLAVPKRLEINIKDLYGKNKLLPETTSRTLSENQDTIFKLNSMSEAISDLAKSYEEAASTILDEKDLKEQELSNEQIFREELEINLAELENNLLYEDILENRDEIVDEIFEHLLKKELITEKELVNIFEKHNHYLIGFKEKDQQVQNDVSKMIKAINHSYRISKMNFIWKKKMEENKKSVSSQLDGVSKAISSMAKEMQNEIQKENKDEFETEKKEIKALLEQKEITISSIKIKKNSSGRYFIEIYTNLCDDIEGKKCDIKKISKILEKVLGHKFIIQGQECGLREEKPACKFTYYSQDNYKLQVGVAVATKQGSPVSGDSHVEAKLEDGKYLLAISDGMGSGPEARKSSKIAIKMLERLLKAGFDKEVSLSLINSTLIANTKEDMYATLDMQILDLYAGNMEFIKNGACPTYIKRNKEVQLLKSLSLPTGILENADLVVYDYDLQDGDIIVMCSDGILEANAEYINKELWVKYLLEDIQTDDAKQIANMILNEAIDSEFGMQKDDMTVIVARINKR